MLPGEESMFLKTIKLQACLLLSLTILKAQTNVLTYHNDVARTGLNSSETILTPANVNSSTFGKLFNTKLDGKVDGQPLYVAGVAIPNQGTHNVLIAATENDSVYALDADTGAILWQQSALQTGEKPSDPRDCSQIIPEIGITATAVINTATSPATIYVVAMSKNSSSGQYYQRLHALSLTTGQEQFGGPVVIQGTYPGTGENSQNGQVIFDPAQYVARAGLLLGPGGNVYIGWSSHCDHEPYTGWIMGYNPTTLAQTSIINITPNGSEGAFWGSGAGIASDSNGNLFALVANGTFDTTLTTQGFPVNSDFGNAFLKVSAASNQLSVADYFTMFNTVAESDADEDLGSGGALVLPDMQDSSGTTWQLAIGAGKDANIYLVNRNNMGKFNPNNNDAIYQELTGALAGSVFSMPAYFNGQVYFGAVGDAIRAFQFTNATLTSTPASQTASTFPFPGATPSISANGSSNGILWAVENSNLAVLHAYLASNLATELYNTNQAPRGRDHFGAGNKFMTPTIVNGKVYVGTPNGVAAFGLLQ
jgi:outer membrane protein assembly factor BamB